MPIKPYALPDRAVRAIETLERAVNTASGTTITASGTTITASGTTITASGTTITASCDDITALIDAIDDLLNSGKLKIMAQIICDIDTPSEALAQIARDASSELLVRFHAVKQAMQMEAQP